MANFLTIPTHLSVIADAASREVLEPIRDMVQRRFQGNLKSERVITRADLIALGIASESDLNKLED